MWETVGKVRYYHRFFHTGFQQGVEKYDINRSFQQAVGNRVGKVRDNLYVPGGIAENVG